MRSSHFPWLMNKTVEVVRDVEVKGAERMDIKMVQAEKSNG